MLSRTSRILLVVAVLAVGAYLLIEVPRQRKADRAEEPEALLPEFSAATIDTLVLQRSDDTLSFARHPDGWHLRAPLEDIAEPSTIETLLDAIATAVPQRNLGHVDDVAPFGLDHPTVHIMAAGHGQRFTLNIGKNTVDAAWSYARIAAGDVLLIPTAVHRAATLPRDDYRNRRVVDFQLQDVSAYRLITPAHTMTWSRRYGGWFTIEQGDSIAGDSVAVESVLRRLRGLRVAAFVDEPTSGPHDATVELWHEDAVLTSIGFSRMPDETWRATEKRRSHTVIVEGDLADIFQRTTTSLRDRRLLQFNPTDAVRIEVDLPDVGGSLVSGSLVRAGGQWSFPNPALGRIDPERAADFVRALRALKWSEVPPENTTPPASTPRFSITVTDASGNILDQMHAEPRASETQWWVSSNSSHGMWLIESALLTDLAAGFERVRAK